MHFWADAARFLLRNPTKVWQRILAQCRKWPTSQKFNEKDGISACKGGDGCCILTAGRNGSARGRAAYSRAARALPCRERKVFVSQTTKRALEASLKKLLLQKPLNKITINDITEDCGVNRMTFYYHFKDIYDLVDWILVEDAQQALEGRKSVDDWNQAFLDVLLKIQANKLLVLNVYRSVSREQVEQYLYKLVDPLLHEFADKESRDFSIQDGDKQFVIDFFKYALVGVVLEWIRKDMKTDPVVLTERLDTMLHGDIRRALLKFRAGGSSLTIGD